MYRIFAALLALCIWHSPQPAAAQDRDDLEQRVRKLESEMQALKHLLQLDKPPSERTKPATPPATTPDPSAGSDPDRKASMVPTGKSRSELVSGSRLRAYLVTKSSYQTPQIGDPLEPGIVDKGTSFKIANYLATPASKTFETHHVGIRWDGYLKIDKAGKHMFTAQLDPRGYRAITKVSVNGKSVLSTEDSSSPQLSTLEIAAPGMYLIEIWMAPQYTSGSSHNASAAQLQFRHMGESSFKQITPGGLYTEKP